MAINPRAAVSKCCVTSAQNVTPRLHEDRLKEKSKKEHSENTSNTKERKPKLTQSQSVTKKSHLTELYKTVIILRLQQLCLFMYQPHVIPVRKF